jgi:hypothetical protein
MAEGAEARWQQARGSRELLERLLERSLERSLGKRIGLDQQQDELWIGGGLARVDRLGGSKRLLKRGGRAISGGQRGDALDGFTALG